MKKTMKNTEFHLWSTCKVYVPLIGTTKRTAKEGLPCCEVDFGQQPLAFVLFWSANFLWAWDSNRSGSSRVLSSSSQASFVRAVVARFGLLGRYGVTVRFDTIVARWNRKEGVDFISVFIMHP